MGRGTMRHAFRETADFHRLLRRLPREDRRLVFYAEHEGYYAYFEGIIDEITRRYDRRFVYITSDPDDPILSAHHPAIIPLYIDRLLPFAMSALNCDVCVMTMTDLNRYHVRRSVHPVHYVYVFHSLISTHMGYLAGAFDHYDTILCAGPHHVTEIRRREEMAGLRPKRLVEAGYYRLERIHRAAKERRASRPPVSASASPLVLVAPSWGPHNVLDECGEALVAMLLDGGYRVIVRPHPETVKRQPDDIDALARRFGSHPSFLLERSVATDDSLVDAAVMISDISGVALEYGLGTERPVIFLDVPFRKIRNEGYGELGIEPIELALRREIGVVVPPDDLRQVRAAIDDLISRQGEVRPALARLRHRAVFAFGRSSAVGADHIMELLEPRTSGSGNAVAQSGADAFPSAAEWP